ncbi:hypothetical protein L1987_73142 [Smallanthus sonchifolius]|uniref:Uncharacterized protein n=1 Tax=Smallanthus sonchifolius TaxID=185202 RepID=A0ACB8ZZ34_9ASTR|nr:hypothetical protein L1987_73142 [Smallanthus sonchifolius]
MGSLPDLSNLTLLQDLQIKDCPSIDASFLGGLWPPKLCSLQIGGLKKPISEWGALNFPSSLVNLTVCYEPHVNNFHQLSDLLPSSLTTLSIEECDNLESLSMGLQHLESLQHLVIWFCPKMKHLPETLLPSLLRLEILECPKLKERTHGLHNASMQLVYVLVKINLESYVMTSTFTTMISFMYILCKHPETQDKAAKEIKEATNRRNNDTNVEECANSVSEESLVKMQYLHASLNKTLRLSYSSTYAAQIFSNFLYFDLTSDVVKVV